MVKRKHLKLIDIPRYESLILAVMRAWKNVKKGRYNLRNLALVTVLVYTGCRLGEALRLRVGDLDTRYRVVKIRQEKKGREFHRIVPVPSDLFWEILESYLARFSNKDMVLFPITDRQARNIVYSFTREYLGRRYRPHSIRHSYAVFLARTTRDLETIRRLLGHSSYTWLKEYLDYTQEDLERDLRLAFSKLEIEYLV